MGRVETGLPLGVGVHLCNETLPPGRLPSQPPNQQPTSSGLAMRAIMSARSLLSTPA